MAASEHHETNAGMGELEHAVGGTNSHTPINLRLPHLHLSHVSSNSGSITPEPLVAGLFGNLKFVEWDEFETEVDSVLNKVTELPSAISQSATTRLEFCKSEVNKVYKVGRRGMWTPGTPITRSFSSRCYNDTPNYGNDDPRRMFRTSISVDVTGYIFAAVRELLSGLYDGKYEFEFPIHLFNLLGIPQCEKPRSPILDRALCTISMNRLVIPPVCTFEMKGPAESFAKHVRTCCASLIYVAETALPGTRERLAEAYCNRAECQHELSPQGLCLYFNDMFSEHGLGSKKRSDFSKKITMMIAQTLVQALTASSGCGFLYTYEIGLAFELSRSSPDGKIEVRTSPLYCCGNQRGAVAAILAVSNYAVKKLSDDAESMSRVAGFARLIVDAASSRNIQNFMGNTSKDNTGPNSTPTEDSHMEPGPSAPDNATGAKTDNGPCTDPTVSATEHDVSMKSSCEMIETINSAASISDVSEDDHDSLWQQQHKPFSSEEGFSEENLLNTLYRNRRQCLESGSSGMVFQAYLNGRRMAVKVWSGEEEGGLRELCNELKVYEFIRTTAPSLLGSIAPKLVLSLNKCESGRDLRTEVALVTEYVGQGLTRDAFGRLWVREEEGLKSTSVDVKEERIICRAALQGLSALHQNNILHGDVALRNLRVARKEPSRDGTDIGCNWIVWWIDFGKASFGKHFDQSYSFAEAYDCALLFEGVEDILMSLQYSLKVKTAVDNVDMEAI